MELNYHGIMDFYRCPLLYKFKHILKVERPGSESEAYKDCLFKVTMFYYYSLMNGRQPSIEQMRNKWYKIWNNDIETIEQILFTEKRGKKPNGMNKTLDGLLALEKFYQYESQQRIMPIVVDTDVRVQIGRHYVTGTIDLVSEVQNEKGKSIIEITRFSNATTALNQFQSNHDFKATFQSFAFRTLFEAKEDRVVIRNVRRGDQITTFRTEEDYKRMIAVVNGIGDAIENDALYPVVVNQCKACAYQDICDKYRF